MGDMSNDALLESRRQLVELFDKALSTVISAIREELRKGRTPRRKTNEPSFSFRDNGMPSLANGNHFEASGPLQYADLLEPPSPPGGPFGSRKFEAGRFPEVDALIEFVLKNPECAVSLTPLPISDAPGGFNFMRIQLEIQLAHAANRFLQRYGEVEFGGMRRKALLAPILSGFFDPQLSVVTVVPIALVKFDFDRLRLAGDAYIIRMSEALQKARWAVKAYGASGHEGVVAAATHAFVITGWRWSNLPWMQMSNNLAARTPALREVIEELFAAFRLTTGVETGYAQELRIARGWTQLHVDQPPEVHDAGARRYPEEFDNFGWIRDDLPTVTRGQMLEMKLALARVREAGNERVALALRRMNGAMMRLDIADAVLDATIALEILLGDGDGQAIAYKLRLRAAALANLVEPGSGAATSAAVKAIYDARSRIVHGIGRKGGAKSAESDKLARGTALSTLRTVLRAVLEYPRFLEPAQIDLELLIKDHNMIARSPRAVPSKSEVEQIDHPAAT